MAEHPTREETLDLIRDLFWEDIDSDVQMGRMDRQGLPYGRPPYATIARDFYRRYRKLRDEDPSMPRLELEDFRDYMNEVYEDAQLGY